MAYVETGAAEAGIVYATDAAISKAVKVVSEIPPQWTEPIRYAAVLLKHGAGKPAAESFYRYLFSPAAATVFQKHGFVVPEDGKTEIADEPPERPFSDALLSAEEWTALRLSFQVAACAALAGLPLAVAVGYLLARGSFGGKWLVESLVNLPLVMPPVVVGYLLLLAFAPRGPIGSILSGWFGVEVVFTWLGAALAAMVMGFPLMVRAIRLSFQSIDPRLVLAARSLGASRTRAFFTVTLPLARRGLVAGWILAFARGLGEFGATIMVAGNIEGQTRTIPLAIFAMSSRHDGMAQAWRLVGLSVLLACGALVASEWLERRGSRDAAA
jgi:molybdate transport system permease protein